MIKEEKKYIFKIDWNRTSVSLIIWLVFISLDFTYVFLFIDLVSKMDQNSQLIGLIVLAFTFMKLTGMIGFPIIYEEGKEAKYD